MRFIVIGSHTSRMDLYRLLSLSLPLLAQFHVWSYTVLQYSVLIALVWPL